MRSLKVWLWVAGLGVFLIASALLLAGEQVGADRIFRAKKILTMDPDRPVATAVAVESGRIT
ncbi:MAG: hypothetical protein P8R45_15070, partial [Candidatus Binatia bacterium]|nr:hypothetical protein [Candidatus Binatia bacterium]